MSFFPIYLKDKNFSPQDIAIINSVNPLIHIVITLSLGYISDKLQLKESILKIIILASFILSLFYLFIDSLMGFIVIHLVFSMFRNPIVPFTDSITLDYVVKANYDYGKIRLWGSLGFIVGSLLLGTALDYLPIKTALYGMSFFLLLCFFSSLSINVPTKREKVITIGDLVNLLKNKTLLLVLLTSFLHMVSLAGFHLFFSVYIESLNIDNSFLGIDLEKNSKIFIGFYTTAAVLTEVFLLNYSRNLLKKYSPFHLLSFTFLLTALRWFLLSRFPEPYIIFLSQLIHAFSFGLFLVVSITYIDKQFQQRLRTSGIALFSIVVFGMGNLLGFVLAGQIVQLYETEVKAKVLAPYYGYSELFFYCGFLALLTFSISLYLSIRGNKTFRLK